MKVRVILHVDGFLSSILRCLFNVCEVVKQWCIICFLHAKTQSTASDPMIIDYWSPCGHLNPSHLTLFLLFYSINPLFVARRYSSHQPISLHCSCSSKILECFPFSLLDDRVLPSTTRAPLLPPPLTSSGQPHISFFWSQFELLFLWAFEFMHLLSLSLSLLIILFWSLVPIEPI